MSWQDELRLARLPRHQMMLASRARMRVLQLLPRPVRVAIYRGERHLCPVCGVRLRRFVPFGHLADEWCPVCASMGRHRLLLIYLRDRSSLFDGRSKRLLHFAPEAALETMLRRTPGIEYVSADLYDPNVMDREDITKMTYPGACFDVVVCSHVLEHVPDDRAAMTEIARVLKPGGWAVVMVPYYTTGNTDEDPSVTDPSERETRFGQFDHVRYYGLNIRDRLEEAGMEVEVLAAERFLSEAECTMLRIDRGETLFICTKPVPTF